VVYDIKGGHNLVIGVGVGRPCQSFSFFGCGGGSTPCSGWALSVAGEVGGFLTVGASSYHVGAGFAFACCAVHLLSCLVFGGVVFLAEFTDGLESAVGSMVAILEASFAVG